MIQRTSLAIPLILVLTAWVWTWSTGRALIWVTPSRTHSLLVWEGKLQLSTGDTWRSNVSGALRFVDVERDNARRSLAWSDMQNGDHFRFAGFAWHNTTAPSGSNWKPKQIELVMPGFAILLVATFPILLAFRRWWRAKQRLSQGLCPSCGFDLRASPDRCPECGVDPQNARPVSPL